MQAAQAFNFVSGIFATAPNLKDLLENETADTISLASGVDITIRPASFRTIRGITAVAAIADEIAFWRSDDCANPDTEILRALRPGAGDDRRLACGDLFASRQTRRTLQHVQAALRADWASINSRRQGSEPDDEPELMSARRRSAPMRKTPKRRRPSTALSFAAIWRSLSAGTRSRLAWRRVSWSARRSRA